MKAAVRTSIERRPLTEQIAQHERSVVSWRAIE